MSKATAIVRKGAYTQEFKDWLREEKYYEPAYILAFAKPSALNSLKRDFLKWRKQKR